MDSDNDGNVEQCREVESDGFIGGPVVRRGLIAQEGRDGASAADGRTELRVMPIMKTYPARRSHDSCHANPSVSQDRRAFASASAARRCSEFRQGLGRCARTCLSCRVPDVGAGAFREKCGRVNWPGRLN